MKPIFEWDSAKSRLNKVKHGISFSEAALLLLSDDPKLEIFDANHSDDEDRLITIGHVGGKMMVVVWTEPEEDIIRIISARTATGNEVLNYFKFLGEQ
ncbi:MAG TPA: BrnT family toxin [Xanthomonadales bacterium]|nr:BrnT family toxin [Xanthomonadales bacterium]